MTHTPGLAVRIFLSYWALQATLLASFALLPDDGRVTGFVFLAEQHGRVALDLFQQQGRTACDRFLEVLERQVGVSLQLRAPNGDVICGTTEPGAGAEPSERGERARIELSPGTATVVAAARSLPLRYRRPSPPFPYLPLGLTVLVSGVVCYLLAQWLTRPLSRMRDASHRIAAGDLRARVGLDDGRNDEIGDLVRDFDIMASRIERLVDAQGQILSDISHELRSPLARLGVALELARRRASPEATPHLDRIEMETERMNELIGRVLSLARAEMTQPAATRVDLAALVQSVVSDASYEAERQQKRVTATIVSGLTLYGDSALIASAVDNVVRNALRHTADGTTVTVSVSTAERHAIIAVHDRGPGVPAGDLDRIFMPFHRVEFARNRETGGVGLGLTIAQRAVRVHGGSIAADNHPDGGLVVTIRLPLTDEPLQNSAES